jgi:molecular chaperone GrpE (heat shock protein)
MPKAHIEKYKAWKASNPEEYSTMSTDQKRQKMLEFKRAELNVQRAMEMSQGDPKALGQLQAMQRGTIPQYAAQQTPIGERYKGLGETGGKLLEAGFPRVARSMQAGDQFAPVSGTMDALSLGQRSLEGGAYGLATGTDPLERAAQLEGRGILSDIATDPFLLPTLGVGSTAFQATKGMGLLPRAGIAGVTSGVSQAPMSALEQYSKTEMGEDFDGRELGEEVVTSAVLGAALPVAGSALKGLGKGVKSVAEGVSGVEGEVLEKVNFEPIKEIGRRITSLKKETKDPTSILNKMQEAKDQSSQLAEDLLNKVDNFESNYIKENPIVMEAVDKMGSTSTKPLIDHLDMIKPSPVVGDVLTKDQIRLGKRIDELKEMIGSVGENISYRDMLKLRRNLDKSINYRKYSNTNPDLAESLQDVSKSFADFLRKSLVEGAERTGVKEYAPAIKKMSEKYDLHDQINDAIGPRRNDILAKQRTINLFNKLNEEGSTAKKEVLEAMSDLTGDRTVLDHADMLEMANIWNKAKNATTDASMIRSMTRKFGPEFGATATGLTDFTLGGIEGLGHYAPGLQQAAVRRLTEGEQ